MTTYVPIAAAALLGNPRTHQPTVQNCQSLGAGGHSPGGCHPGGGSHPSGGCGHESGTLKTILLGRGGMGEWDTSAFRWVTAG